MLKLGQQRVAELVTMESLCAFLIAAFLSKWNRGGKNYLFSLLFFLVTFKIFVCLTSFVAQSVLYSNSVNDS
jgi:hypothetical protein